MLPFIRFRPQRHISRPCASFPLRSDDLFTMSFLAFGLIGNVRLGGFGRRQRFLSTSTTYARLISFRPGMSDARRRLQWASSRVTTLQEVVAYSLFGIFSVHVHLQTSPSSTGSDNLPSSTAVFRPISLLTPLLHTPFHPCPNVLLLVFFPSPALVHRPYSSEPRQQLLTCAGCLRMVFVVLGTAWWSSDIGLGRGLHGPKPQLWAGLGSRLRLEICIRKKGKSLSHLTSLTET
ncbi:uncharacterized protein HD556DRAFT_1527084 [Suillus plorans]|uniref:Uncharacterized protein n=1 Tax=Suillus plorans TaxID=116603 RepID=A0A9P7DIA9_9AGAM|nr:uncharacterized protein HD556DRAFT_1527084 [Suillus plorans]KAG1794686.1 hypothetical protein HD556DRAFT_1527084 [Suillus plorans]